MPDPRCAGQSRGGVVTENESGGHSNPTAATRPVYIALFVGHTGQADY
jgi:hypothetical protein